MEARLKRLDCDLLEGGGFSLIQATNKLISDRSLRKKFGDKAKRFVKSDRMGATIMVVEFIKMRENELAHKATQ